jgi:GNAT superfamily N-acetyltransferase
MPGAIVGELLVRQVTPEELPLLEAMYGSFEPQEVALGLPPRDPERRREWLKALLEGINFVGVIGEAVVGHLAIMPAGQAGELACFVHQDCRRRGVATAMGNAAVADARRRGLTWLWVLIGSDNSPARSALLNYGFHTAWESQGEVKMTFAL